MAAGEGVEPSFSGSKPDVLPVTRSRKNIADFRRASEDFKRTWEKEVRLEETSVTMTAGTVPTVDENSILGPPEAEYAGEPGKYAGEPVQQPSIQAIAPDRVVARQSAWPNAPEVSKDISPASAEVDLGVQPDSVPDEIQPSTKRDWL